MANIITPLSMLSPECDREVTVLRARVLCKSKLREVKLDDGSTLGNIFSVTLEDRSGRVECTIANHACTLFYGRLQVGSTYMIYRPLAQYKRALFTDAPIGTDISLDPTSLAVLVPEQPQDILV